MAATKRVGILRNQLILAKPRPQTTSGLELLITARFHLSARPNSIELGYGAPRLYWFTNAPSLRNPVRVEPSQTGNGNAFQVTIPLEEPFQRTEATGEFVLGVQSWSTILTKDHRIGNIHAGTATMSLTRLLTRLQTEQSGTITLELAIRHGTPDTEYVRKGILTIDISQSGVIGHAPLGAQLQFLAERDRSTALNKWDYVSTRAGIPIQLSNYLISAYTAVDSLEPSFALSRNIRAHTWQCEMGPLPFAAFWSGHTRVPLTEAYWSHLLRVILSRDDLEPNQFMHMMSRLDSSRETVRRVGRVLVGVLTAYSTALPYLTDLYVDTNGEPKLVEWFDRLRLRCNGDCDDFGRDISLLHRELVTTDVFHGLAEDGDDDMRPILLELQHFASQYVCAGMLGTVTQGSVGAGNVRNHDDETQYGAHIWAMLTPRHVWAEWRTGSSVTGDPLPTWLSAYGELLVCEGTGHMDAIVGSRAAPGLSATRRRATEKHNNFFSRNPLLRSLPHEIGIQESGGKHISPFYRQAMWAYAYGDGELVDELYFLDEVARIGARDGTGSHGVSFNDLVRYTLGTQSVRLAALKPLGEVLHAMTIRALEYMCPEPSLTVPSVPRSHPLIDATIGKKALLTNRRDVVNFKNLSAREPVPLILYVPLDTRYSLYGREAVDGGNFEKLARKHIKRAVRDPQSGVARATYTYEAFDENVVQLCVKLYLV